MPYTYTTEDQSTVDHYESYRAIVTPAIMGVIKSRIGESRIKLSEDRHFNDIQLGLWDKLAPVMQTLCNKQALKIKQGLDPHGKIYHWSLSTGVCIAKTAAYIIRTEQTSDE